MCRRALHFAAYANIGKQSLENAFALQAIVRLRIRNGDTGEADTLSPYLDGRIVDDRGGTLDNQRVRLRDYGA
jgi:hypothetical protein